MLPQITPQKRLVTPMIRKTLPAASLLKPRSEVSRFWKNVK